MTGIVNRVQMPSTASHCINPFATAHRSKHPFSPQNDIHNRDSGGSPSPLPKHPPPRTCFMRFRPLTSKNFIAQRGSFYFCGKFLARLQSINEL
jgi:hypothetical protein